MKRLISIIALAGLLVASSALAGTLWVDGVEQTDWSVDEPGIVSDIADAQSTADSAQADATAAQVTNGIQKAQITGIYGTQAVLRVAVNFNSNAVVAAQADANAAQTTNAQQTTSIQAAHLTNAAQEVAIEAMQDRTSYWNAVTGIVAGANINVVFSNGLAWIASTASGGGGGISLAFTNVGSMIYYNGTDWTCWTNGYITNENLWIESWGKIFLGALDCYVEPYQPGGTNRMRFVEAVSNYYYWTTP